MISRDKLILINKMVGFLKILSANNTNYFLEVNNYSMVIYIKSILYHNILESLGDYGKLKNINWRIEPHTEHDWKFKIIIS